MSSAFFGKICFFFAIFLQLKKGILEFSLFSRKFQDEIFYIFLKISDVFTPPNAKLFDITMSVFISRPLPMM